MIFWYVDIAFSYTYKIWKFDSHPVDISTNTKTIPKAMQEKT